MRRKEFHSLLRTQEAANVDIHEMRSLLDRHPYSHIVRLAYLKSLHAIGDDRLGSALDMAAIHLPDRKMLYTYMESLQEQRGSEPLSDDGDKVEVGPVLKEGMKMADGSSKELQRQYLTEAVQSSILMEVGGEITKQEALDIEEVASPSQGPPNSFFEFIAGESTTMDVTKYSFNSDEVVSRFLRNEKREKVDFFDPERMAKKSLDDSGGLVSDTLARIYINQGNLEKALLAYNQLILKYPEKSGYFAARIQKVEELLRNKQSSK